MTETQACPCTTDTTNYHPIRPDQVDLLKEQGCSALNWSNVLVTDDFNPLRVRNVHFDGNVKIGGQHGSIRVGTVEKTCGLFNAVIADCKIGCDVRIANVAVHLANYDISNGVCIENVGRIETNPQATFGNGVEVEVLNEGGGREVTLFNELSAQYAYMMCVHRFRPKLTEKLRKIAADYTDSVRCDRGCIGPDARIISVNEIIDVNIGASATIDGASSLKNGTILSTPDAPTTIGPKVVAQDFIIAESATVSDGATMAHTFVGQGCQMGKQFSAENSLFFANSEAFHGEACSVFGGPYTVTHHKSTLLIAGLFSFYNAGSGSNQSNHMYKLGPVHEGKLARGTKTGSFSYMMWPCIVGPFGVVLGKHTGTFDTSDYPFSHHEARADGKCAMIPGLHLTTVGAVRDGAKWPSRDRRKGSVKRDLINFDVLSPYTIGKMIKASAQLKELQANTDKSIEEVSVGGAMVRRPILRTGQKFYRTGIQMYLLGQVFARTKAALAAGTDVSSGAFKAAANAVPADEWVDIAGQLMPKQRLNEVFQTIESGPAELDTVTNTLTDVFNAYADDEWAWVLKNYQDVFGVDLTQATTDDLQKMADEYLKVRGKYIKLIIADAEKEFDEMSHSGFGRDGSTAGDVDADFTAVRGRFQDNKFVKEMQQMLADLQQDVTALKESLK